MEWCYSLSLQVFPLRQASLELPSKTRPGFYFQSDSKPIQLTIEINHHDGHPVILH